jgi:hypothetical protein
LSSTGFAAGFGLTTGAGEVGAAVAVVGAVGAEIAGEVGSPGAADTAGGASGFDPIVGAVGGGTGIERPMAGRAVNASGGGVTRGDAAAASIDD